ncbi:MAG: cytochrome P450 [Porticoccaceae bacterium]|nr:MAG: cytochrome P450 [Porticoccaceae bacterium]
MASPSGPPADFYRDPAVIQDPHGYFAAVRPLGAAFVEPWHGSLMVTGHALVEEILRRQEAFSAAVAVVGPIPPPPFAPAGDDIDAQLEAHRGELPWSAHLVTFDGNRHTEFRSLLARLLTPQRVRANEDYLRGLADRLIDGFAARGRCEVMADYAHRATTYAISDLLGIPEEDRSQLLALLGPPPSQIEGDAPHKVGPDPLAFLKPFFDHYLQERQAKPRDDLLSELLAADLPGGRRPSLDEVSLLARFLFGAGQDTTARLITMGLKILAEEPDLQERLRRQPERVGDFIEEVLRFEPPVKAIYRIARRTVEVGGVRISAGTVVALCLAAANRDPARFPDPDRFDLERADRDHLAFGKGRHACLGAPLGRLEARVAVERFLARLGPFRLDETRHGPPQARRFRFEPTYSFRSLAELHLEFAPPEGAP